MRTAKQELGLDRLWVVHPGVHGFPMAEGIAAVPLGEVQGLAAEA